MIEIDEILKECKEEIYKEYNMEKFQMYTISWAIFNLMIVLCSSLGVINSCSKTLPITENDIKLATVKIEYYKAESERAIKMHAIDNRCIVTTTQVTCPPSSTSK